MAGKILRCDHDGCDVVFPPAPRRGYHWPIRAEAEKAGWVSSRTGLHSVDNDADATIKDYCPEHTDDLVIEHYWLAPGQPPNQSKWTSCLLCGTVQRADGRPQSPCKGRVRIELRDLATLTTRKPT